MSSKVPNNALSKAVKKLLKRLPVAYEIVKSKDHYFLYINGDRVACVGNNSSTKKAYSPYKDTAMRVQITRYLKEKLGINLDS